MTMSFEASFKKLVPAVDFCALRFVEETTEQLSVRQNVAEPMQKGVDLGAMVTVIHQGGYGYAATSDLTESGIKDAIGRAQNFAKLSRGRAVADYSKLTLPKLSQPANPAFSAYVSPVAKALSTLTIAEKIELLLAESAKSKFDDRIIDWSASLWSTQTRQLYITADGMSIAQNFDFLVPALSVTAHDANDTQTRSFGGRYNGFCQQGGLEILERSGFFGAGRATAEEALQLLQAPNCPTGKMDVILMPDQMMLQIHESIGHPLELDRILGDERNFAGTSFVTLDMFGKYQYGSPLLNVTFDPNRTEQFASYAFDDDGAPAEKQFIIEAGLLKRPLGGAISQARANIDGVANSRACSWNRPPIDRMANLNIEAGNTSLEDMIAGIDKGVMMKTNVSWSIDDSRNKFQFGCEYGQEIINGKLGNVLKNPNYRGISATFWRSLSAVGSTSTVEVMGTPYCGKGEPNQVIRVGHAAPACKFSGIDVFGGEATES